MVLGVILVLFVVLIMTVGFAVYEYRSKQIMYHTMEQMLGEILDEKTISGSDLKENQTSSLINQGIRVQEKLTLEISNANQEKEQIKQLISNMSHQLKTPLSNVMMYVEILQKQEVSELESRQFLEKMRIQSEKIDWILQSLFKMVRLEQDVISFEATNLPIKGTILEAVNLVYEKAEKKQIQIELVTSQDFILYQNHRWTVEVVQNLLENAVKYTNPGGTIQISITPFEMYTKISFRDNGIGIKKEELNQIFQRFYRSSDVQNVEGSGIGLYLAKLILEKEKGYLTVTSEYGAGSEFSVFLQNCKN